MPAHTLSNGCGLYKLHVFCVHYVKRVNRASGFRLEDPEELEIFGRTVAAVVKLIPDTGPFSP